MIEKIKNNKLKSLIIGISCLVFIIGLVMTIVNTKDTYAVESDGYYCPIGGGIPVFSQISQGKSGYYCSIETVEVSTSGFAVGNDLKDDSVCADYLEEAGYVHITNGAGYYCTYEAIPGPYFVNIQYNVNGGTITPITTENGVTYNWSTYGGGMIFRNDSIYQTIINHVGETGEDGLVNYNNPNYINIVKTGYSVPIGSEWKCTSGCTTNGKLFSQVGKYNASDFCSATTEDCAVVLSVNWQTNTYTVTFDANGGNVSKDTITVLFDHTYGNLPIPTKEGYTFDGWYNFETNGSEITASSTVSTASDHTLYAYWTENSPEEETSVTHTITLDNQSSNSAGTSKIYSKSGDGIYLDSDCSKKMTSSSNKITIPTKTGHTFGGYYTSTGGSGTQLISSSGYITSNFTSDRYTANATLYAKWTANTYTVTYNANGGTGSTASSEHTYGVDKTLTANGFSRTDYTFKGWATSANGSVVYTNKQSVKNLTSTNNGTVILYAVWKENSTDSGDSGNTSTTYTVNYDANGGTGAPDSQTKTHGTALTLSNIKPTKIGYKFLGWGTSSSDTSATYTAGESYNSNENITLYAVWEAITYSITYTSNGGNVTSLPQSGTYDEVVTINNPTKKVTIVGNSNKTDVTISDNISTDIVFDGWTSTTINKNTAYYGETAWTNGSIKVTDTVFKNLTATEGGNVTMFANWKSKTITLPTVIKEGYTCNWNTKSDGKGTEYASGGEYTIESDSVATVNLYAQCSANSKTDEDVDSSPITGDALIVFAWLVGIGAIGYSVYYFRSRKSDI